MQVEIQSQPLESRMGARSVFLTPDGLPCSVEELALHYYATPEGGAWTGTAPSLPHSLPPPSFTTRISGLPFCRRYLYVHLTRCKHDP